MLYRIIYRLKYTAGSALLGGIVLLFIKGAITFGIFTIVGSVLLYLICNWLSARENKSISSISETDENGNTKPNYR